jgi:hypothetical protein
MIVREPASGKGEKKEEGRRRKEDIGSGIVTSDR